MLVGMTPWLSAGRRVRQRKVAPHIAEYENGNLAKNILTAKEKIDKRRRMSQNKRKVIERVFGWGKMDRPLRQLKLPGLQRVDSFYRYRAKNSLQQ